MYVYVRLTKSHAYFSEHEVFVYELQRFIYIQGLSEIGHLLSFELLC